MTGYVGLLGGSVPVYTGPAPNALSAPADYSANALAVPYAPSGVPYVLVATVPATSVNVSRTMVEITNLSGALIQVVLDDGLGTAGTISSFLLQGGYGAPSQGGNWSSSSFLGRVRVYAPASTAIVMVRQT